MDLTPERIEAFIAAFTTFFVVINAVGTAPILVSLTEGGGPAHRRKMAFRAVVVASAILYFFAFAGVWLLGQLGITLDAFRAAGGALLFLIALDMVFEKRAERQKSRADAVLAKQDERGEPEDVSVFPIGTPMIAGPGSIATAMLYMTNTEGDFTGRMGVLLALGLNMLVCLGIFLAAGPIVRLIGDTIAQSLGRILGVILAALSAQLMIDGLRGAFGIAS